jgi:integrase/recombinase XerC
MEIREALRAFLQVDCAESTRRTYAKVLTRFVEDIGPGRPLELVRPEDLDAYVFKLRQQKGKYVDHPTRPTESGKLSSVTVYKVIKTVKRFFAWCVEREYLAVSPARFLTNRRPVRPLANSKAATADEVSAILSAARYKPRDWAIVLLLAQSGARASEVAGLRLDEVSLEENFAIITGKGDKRRRILFGPETSAAIRDWLAFRPLDAEHDYVFTSTRGHGPLDAQGISQIIRRLCAVARLDRALGAHAFRHFVGMTLAREKTPLPVIQEYLGHSDSQITAQYLRSIDDEDLRTAQRKLSLTRRTEGDEDRFLRYRKAT